MEVLWINEIFYPLAFLLLLSKLHSCESTQIGQSPCSMSAFSFLLAWNWTLSCFLAVSWWMSQLFTFRANEGRAITNCQSGTDHSLHFSTLNANLGAASTGGAIATQDSHPTARPGSLRLATLTDKFSFFCSSPGLVRECAHSRTQFPINSHP